MARLRTELDKARSEVDVLHREAAASAKLRDELAARWVLAYLSPFLFLFLVLALCTLPEMPANRCMCVCARARASVLLPASTSNER